MMEVTRRKMKIINVAVGSIMGLLSYFIDIHTFSLLLSTLIAIGINMAPRKHSWKDFEENGFWYFFLALFVVWTILYNIRFYTVKPISMN